MTKEARTHNRVTCPASGCCRSATGSYRHLTPLIVRVAYLAAGTSYLWHF